MQSARCTSDPNNASLNPCFFVNAWPVRRWLLVRVVLSFSILVWAYEFDFPPFMVLIMAILNDGTIMTISRDRVVPSPQPDAWNLKRLFSRAIVMGAVQALATIIFFHLLFSTDFFEKMGKML